MRNTQEISGAYEAAKARYKSFGVDTDKVIAALKEVPVSIHCWQGDDVTGLESGGSLTGGIMATGNYPGKARTGDELRADIDKAFSLIPGKKRLNLHAMYAEFSGERVDRDKIGVEHFEKWITWAKQNDCGLDFNPSLFSHPMFKNDMTITHPDAQVRKFWIDHCKRTREIANAFGKELGTPSVNNIWIADGMKDVPADRMSYRKRLADSLDDIFDKKYKHMVDAVESKLFGIGSESFVPGSFEFYMGYAVKHNLALCLDSGHYHPTETISDKLSSILLFVPEVTLHVSRPERWDSDHVVVLNDALLELSQEIVRSGQMEKIHIGLDYFDASINRIGAYVVGIRSTQKALLQALLEPTEKLREYEKQDNNFQRLAYLEELKAMPWNAVYNYYCLQQGIPVGNEYIAAIESYESEVTSKR